VSKPEPVASRDYEWATLSGFVGHHDEHLRIGVVSGQRRVGKSYLLRALTEASGGLHITAVAEEAAVLSRHAGQ
jgi:hypothetical protein